ncbi:TIGR00730 family Rossman fold protein [Agriterribacter sp.]|uniref:LOG family protein n=1 Tax=Agriterribacter sp. TaxID=2821509 RepID=UPI002CEE2B66|nr:TIGR00730 family Rossman fold protein [Agriterribacter sp.]HRO45663.1 TIGR00730 family Rossman fold protein [Agriterribacter sp.]HRQ19532.1 TIGR00730 family Rossman fold protein [Agriterribacter sp.]
MQIQAVTVFCGSKQGANPQYEKDAAHLGKLIAEARLELIYGGGNKGMMSAVANAALQNGGNVTGVIPQILIEWEQQHTGLTELIVTDNIHQRKKLMYELCDAAIVLPGGYGTLDELFEMLTWNQLNIHNKSIFMLNTAGYYRHLEAHIHKMEAEGFLYGHPEERIIFSDTPEALMNSIKG